MAFDGITVRCLTEELNKKLCGGRITKIAQPEKDELILTIHGEENYRLFISANPSLPLLYLTDENKPSPITAPAFCMLLRKHFNSARILAVKQGIGDRVTTERVIDIEIEHLDELGDIRRKHLITEIMGKHSNIILCDESYTILDSIKRVSAFVSSVREVLPGRQYFIPEQEGRVEPLSCDEELFRKQIFEQSAPLGKTLYGKFTGISPVLAQEILYRAGIDSSIPGNELTDTDIQNHLFKTFSRMVEDINEGAFEKAIYYKDSAPMEFMVLNSVMFAEDKNCEKKEYESVSELLFDYYAEKNLVTVIRQKSADLRKIVSTAIEREGKKYELQLKQLEDTEKKDKYRVYGELINTYGYNVAKGEKELKCLNYYDNQEISIPLDPELEPMENAKKYFDKYSKLKRTAEALGKFVKETEENLEHLRTVALSLEIATEENDLNQIKAELAENGLIKSHRDKTDRNKGKNIRKVKSQPLHYVSPEGIHFYVGKNNTQNDELTFNFAKNNDYWFHAKGCPGSHVIMQWAENIPDIAFEDAGALAGYYSSNDKSGKCEIDYVEKKQVKKPAGAKPGFVVYYTNYSMVAKPDISRLTLVE